jgi:agmatine deiminase
MTAPALATMRMPAEWTRHERTLMAWPCRDELWGRTLEAAREDYAAVANAIAAFEPVTMVARPADVADARARLDGGVDVLAQPLDDSWLRDSGPVFVTDGDGGRAGIHFQFNAWGERFRPYDKDAELGARLVEWLGDPVVEAPLVLEGGSIAVDGAGVLMTTEQCLLNPNRNPDLAREEIEALLREHLGVQRVVWLGRGLLEDRDTDGHVDLVAAFTAPGKVLLQMVDEANPNYVACMDNVRRLEAAGLEVETMNWLPYDQVAGQVVAVPYMNFYVCNGALILPVAGQPEDDERAIAKVRGCYPGREVVPVPGRVLAFGGGGPHCITQQVPARGGDWT